MKHLLITVLLLCSIGLSVGAADKPYRSIGYLPNWSYSCYEALDYAALTHLNIAFCNPDASGNMSAGMPDAALSAVIRKAHDNGVKVLASLGGAGYSDNYANLTSAANREGFCDQIVAFAKKYGFDGIDLDVEGEAPAAFWNQYEMWATALRTRCNGEGLLLTTAVGQWYADRITTQTFTCFDFITIMEYHRKAADYPESIRYYLGRGIRAEDLVLGVPFYGFKSSGEYAAYSSFMKENPDSWYFNTLNGATWHNVGDIADIARLSKTCSGVMIWELSQDISGTYSLLQAVKSVLYGDGAPPPITDPVTGVSIVPAAGGEVMARKYLQLSATVAPANATIQSVTWSSSDRNIATVDGKGNVRGLRAGTADITATSMEGGKTAAVTVTVVPNPDAAKGDFPDVYGIISVHSGKAMDVRDKSLAAGARVQQWTLGSDDNNHQRWLLEYVSNDTYRIRSKLSGLYLTAMSTGNGAKVEQHEFRNGNTQQWEVIEVEPGVYSLKSKYGGTALDVSDVSVDNGAEIHLWEDFGAANQKWKLQTLEKAPVPPVDPPVTGAEDIPAPTAAIFPNPTAGILTVHLNAPEACYALYSVSGALLKSGNLPQPSGGIDMTDQPPGVYLLKITAGRDVQCHKIVKN